MSKLEENASLVTALTEIEKKVGQAEIDRNTLKTNLSAKGVDVASVNKMQGLVEKVNEIDVEKHNIPKWYNFSDKWIVAENCISSRVGAVLENVNNYLYLIGGEAFSDYSNLNQQYDIENNTWTNKAPLPRGREHMCSGVVGDKIYILLGENSSMYDASIICYDTKLNVWTEVFQAPETRERASSCVHGDNIYIIGGAKSTFTFKTVYVYNTTAKTWTEKTDMSKARYSFSSTVFEDYIYVFDKWEVAQYSIALDVWTNKSSPPASISYGNSVHTIKNKIFAISNKKYSLCFDPIAETWVKLQTENQSRTESSSCVSEKYYFLVGGYYEGSFNKVNTTTLYIPLETN